MLGNCIAAFGAHLAVLVYHAVDASLAHGFRIVNVL